MAPLPVLLHRRSLHAHIAGGAACKARLEAAGVYIAAAASGLDDARPGAGGTAQRHRAYAAMAGGAARSGVRLGGEITQGLTQADLFEAAPPRAGGGGGGGAPGVAPQLRRLDTAVRAAVLPLLDHAAAASIHEAAAARLARVLAEGSVWWQDPGLLHATLFHASTYGHPVAVGAAEVAAEAAAVARVAGGSCPIHAVLERVVATAGGVLVAPGSGEPQELRIALRAALPRAPPPADQAVREPAMLHTTLARLLAPPRRPAARGGGGGGGEEVPAGELAAEVQRAAEDLTYELCGLTAVFDELWFVEEHDLLALALGGRYSKRQSVLRCRGAGAPPGGGGGGGGGGLPLDPHG
ncbi:MAG: hypothetical protein J3K34DRAFT_516229 [Monoraphidium minutum]|nr:MAG: hypothetical protein J3K34DRAFT_516229 [Monoraphidium minutum]